MEPEKVYTVTVEMDNGDIETWEDIEADSVEEAMDVVENILRGNHEMFSSIEAEEVIG